MMVMHCFCVVFSDFSDILLFFFVLFIFLIFLIFFIKSINYVVGTHLNCIDKSMQFKWVSTTYAFINK